MISRRWLFPLLLILAGTAAYWNSFAGAFQLDDYFNILNNPFLRLFLFPEAPPLYTNRPLADLTLAMNFMLGRFHGFGYHAFNLAVHLAAAITLFGIIRRTLQTRKLKSRYAASAADLALVIAGLWLLHPLQTESVTYIIQRAESLMGLCLLLSLYCVIRSAETGLSVWQVLAVLCCMLGMTAKPVMVTAPVLIAAYDRIFLSDSWKEMLHRHAKLYLGLAASWGVLLQIIWTSQSVEHPISAGFQMRGMTPWSYLFTQPTVILHYLRLSFWPHPLVFDYLWPIARSWREVLPGWTAVSGLLAAMGYGLHRRHPEIVFLGIWFFLTLAPTSLIPLADLASEHRMYLPLAAVIAGAVFGLEVLIRKRALVLILGTAIIACFGVLTFQRNEAYRNPELLWRSVVQHRPGNPRAHCNLGGILAQEDRLDEAQQEYRAALRLKPDYGDAYAGLGMTLSHQGKLEEALAAHAEALRLKPRSAGFHDQMGLVLQKKGDRKQALAEYRQAVHLDSTYLPAWQHLQNLLSQKEGRS